MGSFLKFEKCLGFGFAEIPLQELDVGPGQIHQDETVQRMCKLRVYVEAKQLAAQLEILAKEDGHPRLLLFDVADGCREVLDIVGGIRPVDAERTLQRMPVTNQAGEISQERMLLEE